MEKIETLEKKRVSYIDEYEVYGTAVKRKLYAADAKIFVEFVALIVQTRIYTCLKEK